MGCDYYEVVYLEVEYKSGNYKSIELRRTPHYFYRDFSDDSNDCDQSLDQEMYEVEQRYGIKHVFENGEWKISKRKEEYLNILTNNEVSLDDVLKIYKRVICIERG